MKRDGVAKKAKDCRPTNKSKDGEIGRSNHPTAPSPPKGEDKNFSLPLREGVRGRAHYMHIPYFGLQAGKDSERLPNLYFGIKRHEASTFCSNVALAGTVPLPTKAGRRGIGLGKGLGLRLRATTPQVVPTGRTRPLPIGFRKAGLRTRPQ